MPVGNIIYKTLGFKWLFEVFCPASAFASAHKDEARNPQHFIHVPMGGNFMRDSSYRSLNDEKMTKRKSVGFDLKPTVIRISIILTDRTIRFR
jgi:hypothetical protein